MSHEIEITLGGTKCYINATSGGVLYIHIVPVAICLSNREERKALIAALLEADARLDASRKEDVA